MTTIAALSVAKAEDGQADVPGPMNARRREHRSRGNNLLAGVNEDGHSQR